jgi:hypothetical protein
MAIRNILQPFGVIIIWYIFPVLVCPAEKNMATLLYIASIADRDIARY